MANPYDALAARVQPSGDAPVENPYDTLVEDIQVQQQQRARTVYEKALATNPDHAAEATRLAKQTGMPADTVERNLDEVRRKEQARLLDMQQLAADSPVLARQLADPTFTKQAHDDVGTLTQIAQFFRNTGGAAKAGVFGASEGAAGVFRAGFELAAPALDVLEPVTAIGGNPLRRLAEGFDMLGTAAGNTRKAAAPKGDGNIESGYYSGIQSLTQNMLALPMAFMPGGQGAALTMMTATTGGQSYQEARTQGLTMSQALPYAASQAAIEYATEKIPLGQLIGDVKAGTGILKTLGKQMLLEIPGEQIATALQDMNEWAVLPENKDKPFADYINERPDAFVQTLVATIVGTGGNVAVVKGIETATRKLMGDAYDVGVAEQSADQLQAALQTAAQSRLRERNPEEFRGLMQRMAENTDGAPQEIYLDAEVLNQLPQDVLAQLPPSVLEQLPEALAANDVIGISVADVLTVAPGTPLEQALIENARIGDPMAMTQAEAKTAGEQAEAFLQGELNRVMQQATDQQAMQESSDRVKQTLLDQLNAVGRDRPAVNETTATLYASMFTTLAGDLGITPEQAFAEWGPKIVGQTGQGAVLDTLEQPQYSREQLLELFANANTIEVEGTNVNEGIQEDEARFLSNAPAGTRFSHSTRLLARVRRTSDAITNELGGVAEATREVADRPLGAFTGFRTEARLVEPDSAYNPDGAIKIFVYGAEQIDAGVTAEPALTFTVMGDGELSVNGPTPGGETFNEFKARGWADQAMAGDQIAEGWSALTNPGGGNLPMTQVLELLADVHARVRAWKQADKVGMYWSRATGASAGLGDYGSAVYFQQDTVGDTIEVDGKTRPTKNSNGKPIAQTEEGLRNFWRWFGESKGVDAEGRPLVVYHGTRSDISSFSDGAVSYFGADTAFASGYAEGFSGRPDGANVMSAYLAVANPKWMPLSDSAKLTRADLDRIAAEGFDGVFGYRSEWGGEGITPVALRPGQVVTEVIPVRSTQIKSATGNRGTFDPADANILKQSGQDRDLVVTHNLSAKNLLHAVKMGGIPVPSLAVTKKDNPLTGFGEITLIGAKEMADPKGYAGTKVFGADIYSPRYPTVSYEFTGNMRKRAEAQLKAGMDATDVSYIDWSEVEKGPRELERVAPFMWQFLTDKGITPEIVRTQPKELPAAIRPFVSDSRDAFDLKTSPDFIEAAWRAQEDTYLAAGMDAEEAKQRVDEMKENGKNRGVNFIAQGFARAVEDYRRDSRSAGRIDRSATRYALEKQIREADLGGELEAAAAEFFDDVGPNERIFQGFTPSGNRKYVPHTLENVVKILKKELRGGEGFNYGVGSVRAKFTPQFKSIEQIRKAKDRLIDKAAFEEVKGEIDGDFEAVRESLAPFHSYGKEFGFGDTVTQTMYDAATMGVPRALKENGFEDVPVEVQQEMAEFMGKLRELPTEYFEAKILRDVDLAEFSGAVVPEGVDPKVITALQSRGVKDIRTYKKGDETDRAAKIGEFENLFFQGQQQQARGTFNPQTFELALNEGSDMSTIHHEMGHMYLEIITGIASQPNAPQAIVDQVNRFLKWRGITGDETVGGPDAGGELAQIKIEKATERSRPKGTIDFGGKIVGPSGAALQSYTWQWRPFEYIDERGEDRVARISDWDVSETNAETGREVVHQFSVTTPDGKNQIVSAETAIKLLGYGKEVSAKEFKSVVSASKTMARLQMQLAEMTAAREAFEKDKAEVSALATPEVTQTDAEKWAMGDAVVWQRGNLFPNAKDGQLLPERRGVLESVWRENRMRERGWTGMYQTFAAKIDDLQKRIKKTQAKLDAAGNTTLAQDGNLPTDNTQPRRRTPLETWNAMTLDQKRPHHEALAESYEQYLLTGKAPSVELQTLFRKLKSYMLSVYKSIKQFLTQHPERGQKLPDEMVQFYDRMLASEEQIAQAEEVAGLIPNEDATAEAIEKLTARSLRDLKWTVNARNKAIKALQKQAAGLRKEVEAEVRAEVEQQPVYAARKFLKEDTKLSIAALESVYAGEGDRYALLDWKPLVDQRLAGKEGVHPDIVADMFGFANGDAMVRAILAAEPIASVVEGMTDQRMLERHGDLVDQRAIEEAANDAVHNEARARALATELKAQADMMGARTDTGNVSTDGRKITVSVIAEAAKQFAANVVAKTPIAQLKARAWQHVAAERRAGKRWQEATAAGKTEEAVKAKQDQVLNNAAAKAANEAQAEAKKIIEFFRRVTKDGNEKTVEKGRDPDVVNAARAVLAAYGVAPRAGKSAMDYLDVLEKNDPAMYAALQPSVQGALNMAQPLDALTMDELRALHEEVQAMWHLAKRSRQMEVDGKMLDIEEAEDELQARMQEIGVPDTMPGDSGALTPKEELARSLQHALSLLTRAEQWAQGMGKEFTRLIFQPIKDAADRYRTDRIKYRKKYQALVDKVAPHMPKGLVEAPELGYTFGKGHNGIGMAELLHAILHTGNASNKRKLLLGRQWATENADGTLDTSRWDAFIARLVSEGTLKKEHYDFAQGVWDLLEETKTLAQKAHRDVFGRYFAEVTAEAFDTPFGNYRGGYVPAQADGRLVQDAAMRRLAEQENENMAFSFPTTNKGFTKSRTEYNRPLVLDLRTIGQHLDKVLLFSHMEPAARDVQRLISRKGVSYSLGRIDPTIYEGMLTPWLNRSAKQIVETPIVGDGRISRVLSVARSRAGMSLMFANVSNTLQQITGFSLAAVKVKPANMMRSMAQYVSAPRKMTKVVADASPFMANRMENEVAAINDAMNDILLDPSLLEKAQAWTQRHAYFMQTAMANTMEPIIWTAAYNEAIQKGESEKDAVRHADSVIRTTQGSTLAEDVSRIETGPAYGRIFTQFIGYFNMMANTNAAEFKKVREELGLKKGAGKAAYIATVGLLIPLWTAEAIAIAMRGGPDDEDDDGYLDDWLAAVFGMGTIKGSLAMVPFVGQFANAGINRLNDNPADDRVSMSPAVSLVEGSVGVLSHVVKAAQGEEINPRNAVRDTASAIGIALGLPAYAIARPLGYAAGVADDRIDPTGPVDMARGLISGTPSPESKQ